MYLLTPRTDIYSAAYQGLLLDPQEVAIIPAKLQNLLDLKRSDIEISDPSLEAFPYCQYISHAIKVDDHAEINYEHKYKKVYGEDYFKYLIYEPIRQVKASILDASSNDILRQSMFRQNGESIMCFFERIGLFQRVVVTGMYDDKYHGFYFGDLEDQHENFRDIFGLSTPLLSVLCSLSWIENAVRFGGIIHTNDINIIEEYQRPKEIDFVVDKKTKR